MDKPLILIVDDEPYTADALCRLFRLEPVTVEVANDGETARQILSERQVALAIIDYYMPGMTGIELIDHIAEIWPETSCFLLSGQSDIESILDSMESKNFLQFFSKPWNNDEMLNAVVSLLKKKGLYGTGS